MSRNSSIIYEAHRKPRGRVRTRAGHRPETERTCDEPYIVSCQYCSSGAASLPHPWVELVSK